MSKKILAAFYILTVLVVGTYTFYPEKEVQALPPRKLKFYPKKTTQRELYKDMQVIQKSLGTQCSHCHSYTPRRDFAKNTKKKKVALQQMFLTRSINEKIKKFFPEAKVKVTCYTCHRGKKKPRHKPDEDEGEKKLDMSKHKLTPKFKELVKWINKDLKKTFPKNSKARVTCFTCHRGEEHPKSDVPKDDDDDDDDD